MQLTDRMMQKIVGNVLRYGVRTVLSVGILGGVIFLIEHANETVDYSNFVEKDQHIFTVVDQIFIGVGDLDGRSIIYLAILILFFTPLLRLLLSLISFILEKDSLYIAITILVLLIICLSVYSGFAH
ncbi:putative membrane protein [Sphingobacterium allocomposti]|uniref:Putative membrane protein n=2 Tax=Sphingobacterium allocomposti TaxID=415956 RepID=A0A5S5DSN7_9SPHI|nr:putative membrane protein [Sphingobacterium composti Yoo et al. 2007 non Ten et al. 2007]